MICECENCGKSFNTGNDEWYDLCDVCCPVYEQALYEARSQNPDILRIPFPDPVTG